MSSVQSIIRIRNHKTTPCTTQLWYYKFTIQR